MADNNWGDVDASGYDDKKKINDVVPIFNKQDYKDTFKGYRFLGPVQPYQQIWLPVFKDGKQQVNAKKAPIRVPFFVTNFDLKTHKIDPELPACPYVECAEKMNKYLKEDDQLRVKIGYLGCAIDREAQENPPRKVIPPTKAELKSGFYNIESPTTKMTGVFDMTPTLFRKVKGLKELNKWKNKKTDEVETFFVNDDAKGCDVSVKFSPKEKGGAMYDAQKGDKSPRTEEEQEYLLWDVKGIIEVEDHKTAKKEADRLWKEFAKSLKGKGQDEDDDDEGPSDLEDDVLPKKKKKTSVVDDDDDEPILKKKKKPVEDDDEDEEDIKPKKKKPVIDDDDEEEEVKPKKKKKPVEDDDEDEDEPPFKGGKKLKKVVDDDDDDEEDEPTPKKKKKVIDDPDVDLDDDEPAPKKKKKPVEDDDEEEEVKPKKKKKPVEDDDDDIESLEDDDDDEEEVKPKKKKKPVEDDDEEEEVKPKKKKKPVEDDDDDDDEEEEVKPKKKKKRVVDDDDDD